MQDRTWNQEWSMRVGEEKSNMEYHVWRFVSYAMQLLLSSD